MLLPSFPPGFSRTDCNPRWTTASAATAPIDPHHRVDELEIRGRKSFPQAQERIPRPQRARFATVLE